ncbi:HlyD family efflux transporter periplasmic adaptor subunit [Streptomyces sp. WAC06614]|uniref:HlyD family efflux transporter periplasmic adaptor subunit n=1 Tax=Streptomyces sp. WAC06614 TaxID=2487416 RepID=UPI000F78C9BD|nr:HlyD family efflux transporter periplasmic adaptor subunit [Streptomyces sp. WAC06614]RSS74778.1 HlyD family efflux transporter periplasmic adaptor subunit [Streptomyces sp. WAC06614]
MQFRHKALARLRSPEELDLPVRLARPQGRLALAVTLVVMAAATFWAATGSVSVRLSAPGILTHAEGSYLLQSPVAGQVTAVLAEEGRLLPPAAPLLRVATDRGEQLVRLVAGGRITTLTARTGSVVTPGAEVATVARVRSDDDPLVAVLYLPAADAATVPVGARADLTVPAVPTQRYGVLRGRVRAVGRSPQTQAQLTGFLGDPRLAARFGRQGDPVAVLVDLSPSATTRSGYHWSSADGPPYPLDPATPVTAAVHLAAQQPLDWLLP